jgi:NADH dehydrogenase
MGDPDRITSGHGGRCAAELLRRAGAAEHAFPLYSVADAERLRRHLQGLLKEAMSADGPPEPGMLDVVVVGGGPTGVETTGALAELMNALSSTGRLDVPGQITIVDHGSALLGQFSSKAHHYAVKKLTDAGRRSSSSQASPRFIPIMSSSRTAALSGSGSGVGGGESGQRSRKPLDLFPAGADESTSCQI